MNARRSGESLRLKKPPIDEDKRILKHSLGTGATPLSTTHMPEVSERQEKVQARLRGRITRELRGRSQLIRDFAEFNFLGRFARRLERNRASYDTRLETDIPAELQAAHDRVLIGDGSVKDALEVMEGLKMRSIELARLTHPDTDMATNQQLHAMRDETYAAITELGGTLSDDPQAVYEMSNIDTIVPCGGVDETGRPIENAAVRDGIMVTSKHHRGTMPDGTLVVERTSYIIDLNHLPEELATAIRSVNTLEVRDGLTAIAEIAELETLLPCLLEQGSQDPSVIPMSTTIFAYNPLVAKIISETSPAGDYEEPSDSKRRLHAAFAEDVENLAAAWRMSPEQVHDDLTRRGLGFQAIKTTTLEDDE